MQFVYIVDSRVNHKIRDAGIGLFMRGNWDVVRKFDRPTTRECVHLVNAWSLPVTWQRWRLYHSIRHIRKPHATCKLDGSVFSIELELWLIEILHCRNRDFRPFCFCNFDLDPDPMTFIHELDPYFLEIYRMCENELPTSRLTKVIVW